MRTQTTTKTTERATLCSMSDEEVLLLKELALRMGYIDEGIFYLPEDISCVEAVIRERSLDQRYPSDELQVKAA